MIEFDQKYDIVDEVTPSNVPLTAHYKKSFAYYTIRERLPVIVTQIVDHLSRDKDLLVAEFGEEEGRDAIKEVQGKVSKLKYELQTDKILHPLSDNVPDLENWNSFLSKLDPSHNSYFTTVWLIAECYMYRRLKSIFDQSGVLKDYDYFRKQKKNALTSSYESMIAVLEHLNQIQGRVKTDNDKKELIIKLLKLNLWGNRCDLSISIGREVKPNDDPFSNLQSFDSCLLVDKCELIWSCLKLGENNDATIIDFVQDNSGYELFTDFILAKALLDFKLANRIRFHVKTIPWFISDIMKHDFYSTVKTLSEHETSTLAAFGQQIDELLKCGKFELCPMEYFWTGPYEYHTMKVINQKLYEQLSEAHLIIFKGDLNYRKLLGDFNWPFNTPFETTLRGFRPSNLCALRTVKADLICELKDGIAEELSKSDSMWMETGQYGVIHFAPKIAQ